MPHYETLSFRDPLLMRPEARLNACVCVCGGGRFCKCACVCSFDFFLYVHLYELIIYREIRKWGHRLNYIFLFRYVGLATQLKYEWCSLSNSGHAYTQIWPHGWHPNLMSLAHDLWKCPGVTWHQSHSCSGDRMTVNRPGSWEGIDLIWSGQAGSQCFQRCPIDRRLHGWVYIEARIENCYLFGCVTNWWWERHKDVMKI